MANPRSNRRGARRYVPSWRQVLAVGFTGFLGVAAVVGVAYARTEVPAPAELTNAQATVVTYAGGEELGRFQEQNRLNVDLEQVPRHVRGAVLAAEDRSFYENSGISVPGIARAFWNNVTGGETQGASTITQQYAKIALTQDGEQSYQRKVREALIAVKLGQQSDKDQILEDYLNTVYFGRGAYGIQTAAQAYFGKPVEGLTLSEGAVLASLIQQPSRYEQPEFHDQLEARWDYTLDGMVTEGWLSQTERDAAVFPELAEKVATNRLAGTEGYLLATVRRELRSQGFSDQEIERGGLRVTTTFQAQAQASAERAVAEEAPTEDAEGLRVGLAAVQPGTGAVVALYGGADYVADQFDNATQGRAQPGSTFKPFALIAALEDGISLRSRYNGNSGRSFEEYNDGEPVPNYGGTDFGRIDLVKATASSVNTVYVELGLDVGPEAVEDVAIRAGIPQDTPALDPFPSIVLGVADTRVIDVAGAYATLAAQGVQADPYVVQQVQDDNGAVLYQADPQPERVFAEDVMADVTYALTQVVEAGSGSRAQALDRPVAGKTGTTNDGRSAWFAGYTPRLAAAVGLYRFDENRQPISLDGIGGAGGVTGGNYPARIWTAFMQGALEGQPVQEFPERANVGSRQNSAPSERPRRSSREPSEERSTRSSTPTPSETESETESESETETSEPSASPSATPSSEPTGSRSPSPSPSSSATASASASPSAPSPSATPSRAPTTGAVAPAPVSAGPP